MSEYLEICFSGPVLPASVLLLMVTTYWLFAIIGVLGLDFLDFDLDLNPDSHLDGGSALSLGLVGVRILNLGRVPLMIWVSIFSLSLWAFSMFLDEPSHRDSWTMIGLILLRNVVVALVITKLLTQPLVRFFAQSEPNRPETLIGRLCVVSTSEVTETFGQAKLETDGAPLLLNVRFKDGQLGKGDVAEIVDYDPHHNVYWIAKTNTEV
jgi:hypothetical protein